VDLVNLDAIMEADLDVYIAIMHDICKCDQECTCDDSLAMAVAQNPAVIQL